MVNDDGTAETSRPVQSITLRDTFSLVGYTPSSGESLLTSTMSLEDMQTILPELHLYYSRYLLNVFRNGSDFGIYWLKIDDPKDKAYTFKALMEFLAKVEKAHESKSLLVSLQSIYDLAMEKIKMGDESQKLVACKDLFQLTNYFETNTVKPPVDQTEISQYLTDIYLGFIDWKKGHGFIQIKATWWEKMGHNPERVR